MAQQLSLDRDDGNDQFLSNLAGALVCTYEGIVTKHFPAYDHLSMNNIPKSLGFGIAAEWREVALRLEDMTAAETRSALNLPDWYGDLDDELASRKTEISAMLRELADGVDDLCEREDWFCILGM